MRMSDEEYFRSCVAKERHLAQLLGHHNIEEFYEDAGTLWTGDHRLPKWTRDWSACGPLLAKHHVALSYRSDPSCPDHDGICASSNANTASGSISVLLGDHPDKDQATRCAIVKAVICALEHAAHAKHGKHPKDTDHDTSKNHTGAAHIR